MTKEIQQPSPYAETLSEFDRAFDQMRSTVFDPFGFPLFFAWAEPDTGGLRAARTDVRDTGTAFQVVAEIPGIPKENLDIRIRGTTVEIRGEASADATQKDAGYVHRERTYSGYYRSVELPEPVVGSDAKAKVENGLLELELPKRTPTPPETEVKVRVV
jgi:HSP20 family protein